MGRTLETAAVETKSSLPLLTTYRPLPLTWPVQPGSLGGPCCQGMKKIGFLSSRPLVAVARLADAHRRGRTAAVGRAGSGGRGTRRDGAYFRVHHFARQLASPFPLLAAVGARTSRIEIGTGVIRPGCPSGSGGAPARVCGPVDYSGTTAVTVTRAGGRFPSLLSPAGGTRVTPSCPRRPAIDP